MTSKDNFLFFLNTPKRFRFFCSRIFLRVWGKIRRTKKIYRARCWWLTPVILATQEAENRSIAVQSQLWANSLQDAILKILNTKRADRVA
jgi:hypothetical protein